MRERNYNGPEFEVMKTGLVGKIAGAIHRDTTQFTGTDVGTEQTSHTITFAAGALNLVGRKVTIRARGTTSSDGDNKTVKLYFGTASFTTGAVAANNKHWWADFEVYITGAATQKTVGSANLDGIIAPVYGTGTADTTAEVTCKCTVTNAGADASDTVVEIFEIILD